MRRILLLTLTVCCSIVMMAGDITPEQALQQASNFMKDRVAQGSRRAPVTEQQLTMTEQVSGLYVFNVANNGGFVIVSNDDIATPILGYADNGNFDPQNIPSNMKAWLQGYADEIAWAKKNNVSKLSQAVSHRSNRAVKAPIAPLVQTKWNQDSPYNDLCPVYSGTTRAATGCVATAMAQVMNYHQWPTAATTAIPGYTKDYRGDDCIPVSELSATIFSWGDMEDHYTGSETDAQKDAVAKLMQYCGASLKMNYGQESSSNTDEIETALKTYFDYSSTVTFVSRSFYSYANWINMMYHELSEGRPICYGGQSSGGGHEFVCDGYQGEDYFHINWGWGGMSDNYFKLSALNPYSQGIGGSSSRDGYHYGQDAVIGIQKNGGTGTILSVPTTTYDLTLNSISSDKTNITTDETAEITLNITNNNSKDLDGDIWLYVDGGGLWAGKTFQIAAGAAKDCKVTFSPKDNTGSFDIYAMKPLPSGGYWYIDETKHVTVNVTAGTITGKSSDLDLTATLKSIEYANASKTEVYGNDIKAVITISNPSTTTNFEGYFRVYKDYVDYPGYFSYNTEYITVPANGSYDFEFNEINAQQNFNYKFTTCYIRTGSEFTAETDVISGTTFKLIPGIFSYAANGTVTAVKATDSYSAPSDALAIDVSGANVTSITPNSNPNTIYVYNGSKPSGLDDKNTIQYTGSTYTATNITLTDGSDFYSPVDFTATKVEFTYSNDRWANGTKGWNTLVLPFNVTSVTADGTAIDWFHSNSDTGKQFWVKKFDGDAGSTVNFVFADAIEANVPYIIALPGDHWGAEYNLSGKTIKFIGENVTVTKGQAAVVTGDNYRFMGGTKAVSTTGIYTINNDGDLFTTNTNCAAFRAYFKPDIFDRSVTSLNIGGGGGTTGLLDVRSEMDKIEGNVYYDLQGHRVLYPKKGLYILNGKKVILK
ncbi:MAG: C10 family peptidase [Prevotella sp.]|nr:C10 family peptidase [Prevotella sp.]